MFIVGVCDVFRIRWSQVTIEALQEQLKAGQAREEKAAKLMANEVQQRTKDTAALRACEADAAELRKRIEGDRDEPILLLFGTGYGMAPELIEHADIRLPAIVGPGGIGDYNHLSVRAAAVIVMDRLLGS